MSSRSSQLPVAFLAAALLVGGCTKDDASPSEAPGAEDRTLQKLRAEADRVRKGGAPSAPPDAVAPPRGTLADLAAVSDEGGKHRLALPEHTDTVHVDTVAMKLTSLESSHSLKGNGKLGLTTEDLFLRVQLVTQNVGAAAVTLSMDGARLEDAQAQVYRLARDAQAVAGTRPMTRSYPPEERSDLVLLFEVPPATLQQDGSLTLVVQGSGGDVRIPLR
ncbi:hypothetical protein DRW03_05275 [Corallococcus sp. H22C18031201]|uniref:hypothetical protein n=1 Tax=Citreicoccus inhibens TaxID=2849499 RepID=UPI000E746A17|nr:hypothetical protein [Citreicoccus inhibens]MBU8896008.1 hypothetical protein [Citreicoccus inhibens]RJS25884.1 hypothetical protein DRW03_05275 [Corallococcus sp. H22C18031201]